jgi:hypothetical protein
MISAMAFICGSKVLDLEQADDLGGLAHLVDGVVQRGGQVLDVAAVERRDEGAADGLHHLAGDLVGLFLVLVDAGAGGLDAVAALHQVAQRAGSVDQRPGVRREQVEELVFLRHHSPEQAQHRVFPSRQSLADFVRYPRHSVDGASRAAREPRKEWGVKSYL